MSPATSDLPVVVVGAGLAGLTAASRAAELGAHVVVMEAGPDADYACSSRITGGVFHIAHRSTDEPPETLADVLQQGTFGSTDPRLARLLVDDAPRAVEWLESRGARLEPLPFAGSQLKALAPYNRDGQRGRGPDVLLRALAADLIERGGRILYDHRVTGALTTDGNVVGVRYRTGDREDEMLAKSVVLADGGFQNNTDLVRRHIAPKAEAIVPRNGGVSDGTALSLCADLGARLVHLDSFYGHLLSADALSNKALALSPVLDQLAIAGLIVDRHGSRFCDEGLGGVDIANKLARRPDPNAVVICDALAWDESPQSAAIVATANPELEKRGGTVYRADTISELASLAGLPADRTAATVNEFNRFADQERGAELSVPRTAWAALRGVRTAPFRAIPVVPGITFTMGGPLIDEHARVQSEGGQPIAGLYAVGSAAGGFDGGVDVGYAGGLIRCAVTGLAAAEHIARRPTGT